VELVRVARLAPYLFIRELGMTGAQMIERANAELDAVPDAPPETPAETPVVDKPAPAKKRGRFKRGGA
jgi:hypothetical protein